MNATMNHNTNYQTRHEKPCAWVVVRSFAVCGGRILLDPGGGS